MGPVFLLRKIGRLDLELEAPAHAVVDVEAGDLGEPRMTRPLAKQRKVDLPVPRTRRVGVVGEERGAALGKQWTRQGQGQRQGRAEGRSGEVAHPGATFHRNRSPPSGGPADAKGIRRMRSLL